MRVYSQVENPITIGANRLDRARILALFPELAESHSIHFLGLRRYLRNFPEAFFSKECYSLYLAWLRNRDVLDYENLKSYFREHDEEIASALATLREVNSEKWHDEFSKNSTDYEILRFVDRHIHPTYLKLLEGVLAPLSRMIAYFSRRDRQKSADNLDIWNVVQELEGKPEGVLCSSYRNVTRNGIGHGGVVFFDREIRYRDKKGNEENRSTSGAIRLCDDLVDSCNGIVAALRVFFAIAGSKGYSFPTGSRIQELQEEVKDPWWSIEGVLPSEIPGQRQLIVYGVPASRYSTRINAAVIRTGILAEYFAPGYNRYFVSMRSKSAGSGWAIFDGDRLKILRESGATELNDYVGVIKDNLIMFLPSWSPPKFLERFDLYWKVIVQQWRLALSELKLKLGYLSVMCRNASIHFNGWRLVLNGEVCLGGVGEVIVAETVRKSRRRIVGVMLSSARKKTSFFDPTKYFPLGFCQISVFEKNFRKRRLNGFGLGKELICTIRFHGIKRIRVPNISGSTVESKGRWEIAWNRSWLEANSVVIVAPQGWRVAPAVPLGSFL